MTEKYVLYRNSCAQLLPLARTSPIICETKPVIRRHFEFESANIYQIFMQCLLSDLDFKLNCKAS